MDEHNLEKLSFPFCVAKRGRAQCHRKKYADASELHERGMPPKLSRSRVRTSSPQGRKVPEIQWQAVFAQENLNLQALFSGLSQFTNNMKYKVGPSITGTAMVMNQNIGQIS